MRRSCRGTRQPGSEPRSAELNILCAGGTAASRGGGKVSTSVDGSSAAGSSAKHVPTRTDSSHRSGADHDESGRGHILLGFSPSKARFRVVRNGGVTGVADDGRRGVHFQFPVRKDVAKFLPSGWGKEDARLPRNLRGRSRGRVPIGGGIHAMATHQESGFFSRAF